MHWIRTLFFCLQPVALPWCSGSALAQEARGVGSNPTVELIFLFHFYSPTFPSPFAVLPAYLVVTPEQGAETMPDLQHLKKNAVD